jgi:hypothetical protein
MAIIDQRSFPSAMAPDDAKALAANVLARSEASRWQLSVRLPWRHVSIRAGESVTLPDQPGVWRVRQVRFESFVVHLELEREAAVAAPVSMSDGGRAMAFADAPVGETVLSVLDLPSLPGDPLDTPRLWLAAASSAESWRRAPVEVSADGGESYALLGTIGGPTAMGTTLTALPDGPTTCWDRGSAVEVELLSDTLWLEGRSPASVLAGANLAVIGSEIVQFCAADMLGPRRFRLTGLLRGRLGTEQSITGHSAGERFVLLDRATMLACDLPADALGRQLRFRAAGAGDGAAPVIAVPVTGQGLRPLSPVHLRLIIAGDDVVAKWTRRSRAGFGWSDFVDAPLAELDEAYRVEIWLDGRAVRVETTREPGFTYTAADRRADGDGVRVSISVAQLSASVGPGAAAQASVDLTDGEETI